MNAAKLLNAAGIHCYTDSADVDHFRYSREARQRTHRFNAAQTFFMLANGAAGVFAGRLVCLDLVRPSDLPSALQADVYSLRGRPCIEWPVADRCRIDRRALSSFTALLFPRPAMDHAAEVRAFQVLLSSIPEYSTLPSADLFIELERDLVCWASQRIPKPLWAHICRLRPMTALARHHAALADTTGVPLSNLDEAAISRRAEAADMLDIAIAAAREATSPWSCPRITGHGLCAG